jgi:transcription antitermination factor NusG
MDSSWCLAYVIVNWEKKVSNHLTARSIENYLPLVEEESQWSDRRVSLARPLFPCYVFVRSTRIQRVLVLSTPGVVRNGLSEQPIPEFDLERIRLAISEGYKLTPHLGRAVGTRVRFRTGLFSGAEGVGSKIGEERFKVVIALRCSQQLFSVESEVGALDVLDQHAPVNRTQTFSKSLQPR